MHTVKVICGGLLALAVCLGAGFFTGSGVRSAGKAALFFIPIWFVAAAFNMWVGVAKAGYSFADEAPIFLMIFAVPAIIALLLWWRLSRG
jgi:hypothetical protein